MKAILLLLIRMYWRILPEHKRRPCVFKQTCSTYVYHHTVEHGFLKGISALLYRMKKCRPGYKLIANGNSFELRLADGTLISEEQISDSILAPVKDSISIVTKKYITVFLLLFIVQVIYSNTPISFCSWNIQNFGKSKSESEINFIANTIKDFDVVAIIEVVAGDGGAQAVAKLNDVLNRKGAKWDYTISNPTISNSYKAERYAFLWKTSKLTKVGDAWLEQKYNLEIDREPYFATFKTEGKEFTLVTFHALTKSKQPETEIKYFKFLPAEYPAKNLIFSGDFNCPESHTVFNPLKSMGYKPIFTNQKTTLKQECVDENYLASEFDNIFYNASKIKFVKSGVIHFYKSFTSLADARTISDHVPIYFQFSLN
jgi:putative component of membrane protein insertase Oxa1/YidC/SpoIIIJ protein YidD/endonuclease/exonuclease/phosphatase family metal-dependent hydrolase